MRCTREFGHTLGLLLNNIIIAIVNVMAIRISHLKKMPYLSLEAKKNFKNDSLTFSSFLKDVAWHSHKAV